MSLFQVAHPRQRFFIRSFVFILCIVCSVSQESFSLSIFIEESKKMSTWTRLHSLVQNMRKISKRTNIATPEAEFFNRSVDEVLK